MILNIETSSKYCSVVVCHEGMVNFSLISDNEMDHASQLAPFVEKCFEELRRRDLSLDAVAVSMGPGSYTGLRIGLSLAKGLCFGLGIPLIGVPTLKQLAVKAMFSLPDLPDDVVFIPTVDARRDEVYTAAYNLALEEVLPPQALILDAGSYSELAGKEKVFIGSGANKTEEIVGAPNSRYIFDMPVAADMTALSEKALREKDFIDVAYSTPFYLKNFMATTPKKVL